ncbi:MAG: hypothetical protein IIV16_00575 [Alistipes sp.]|nr:hypothetical protein [Alistipes sp.]
MKYLAPILILFAMVAGGCYNKHNKPEAEVFDKFVNCNIEQLRALGQNGCHNITTERICIGRITSSDRDGNFYRSIIVEDESGGAEIKLGTYSSATQYPIGLEISLHLKGLAVMVENGVIQVGLPPQSHDSSPRELEAQAVIDRHIVRSTSVAPTQPSRRNIVSLTESDCGRFVRINGVKHVPIEEHDADCTIVGYHRFIDSTDKAIFTYVSPYADFATSEIPASEADIQGILYCETINAAGGKQFVIKPRFAHDISPADNSN